MKKLHRARRTLYVFAGTHPEMLTFMAENGLRSNEVVFAMGERAYRTVATTTEPVVLVESATWPLHESMVPPWEHLRQRARTQNQVYGHRTKEIRL